MRLPFLKIAEILPSFHSLGNLPSDNDLLKSLVSGIHSISESSCKSLGWIQSGPQDLPLFSPESISFTFSSLITNTSISAERLIVGICGISPSGSTVKTLEKNCPRTSAFSLSDVVSLDVGSAGSVFSIDLNGSNG